MFNVNDIKNGMTIKYEGNIYQVVEFQHVKPGKGSAFVKTKLKNLRRAKMSKSRKYRNNRIYMILIQYCFVSMRNI